LGSESPEQLQIRRRLEEQAMYEQAARMAQTRNRAGNAVGGGGGTNTNFAALFSLIEGQTTYAQSATRYIFSIKAIFSI